MSFIRMCGYVDSAIVLPYIHCAIDFSDFSNDSMDTIDS